MKKDTRQSYHQIINKILYQIHLNISKEHTVNSLSSLASMSPFHFSRVFKQITKESPHSYLRRIRLEYSANALLFNPNSSITEILQNAGFASNSSFTHAFKEHFGVTPTKWREVDTPNKIKENIKNIPDLQPQIGYFYKRKVAYVRHKGYDKSIKDAWLRLFEFCENFDIEPDDQEMIGLHHSNPNIVKSEDCHYVAAITVDKEIYPNSKVGIMTIPKIFCAKFPLQGKYGDLMKYMDYIYYFWLPNSLFEKIHLPSLAIYRRNHFIEEDESFDLDFYVPIKYKE